MSMEIVVVNEDNSLVPVGKMYGCEPVEKLISLVVKTPKIDFDEKKHKLMFGGKELSSGSLTSNGLYQREFTYYIHIVEAFQGVPARTKKSRKRSKSTNEVKNVA